MNGVSGVESPRRLLFILSVTMLPILLLMGLTGAIKAEPERVGPFCEQAENRVPNPGFEAGIDESWTRSGGIGCYFYDDSSAYEGSNAATISEGQGDWKCTLFTPIDEIPVQAGRFYDLSAWLKVDSDSAAHLSVSFWRLEDLVFEKVGDPVLTPILTDTLGAWERVTIAAEAPSDAEYARVELTFDEILDFQIHNSVSFDKIYFGPSVCLEIDKSGQPQEVSPEDWLVYTIVYSNTGSGTATGVVVKEIYDDDVQYLVAIPEPISGTNNIWEIGELGAGESGAITAVVQVERSSVNQNWLINKVSIDADEMVTPISDVLYTGVLTDGVCAIDLLAVPEAQTGKPGQTVDYDLELLNVGLFEGEAELTAISDLNLGIIFDPVTHSLGISGTSSGVMHINVPSTVTIPSTDTTWITATLVCPGDLVDDAQEPVSTRMSFFTQLVPTLMKDHCGTDAWEVEPNNTCEQAHGPLCLGKEFYGYPDDPTDIYLSYAPEGGISVDLYSGSGDIPPSEGIQLGVCPPNLPCPSGCTWDSIPEDGYHLDLPDMSGPVYIWIFKAMGYSSDWTYTLRVSEY